ncbi:MAG: FecR domain-containing protein, partial [bacterium]
MKPELSFSSLIGVIMAVAFCSAGAALAATDEIEVGVTAASVTNATGKPPISPARDLETGLEVFFNEKITTNASGRAQLLFRDGTSLTVGSSSEMTIDEYVFDPDTDTGELVINISKGIFRLVGGKISKNTPVVFNTKTATVAVRGGIAMLNVDSIGTVQADFIYGQQMTVTSMVAATGESVTGKTSRAGTFIEVDSKGVSQPQKRDPTTLTAMISDLERPVKKRSPAAEESTPQSTESEASVSPAQEDQAETDKAEAAGTEPTSQVSQEEEADSPPTEPGADTEVA